MNGFFRKLHIGHFYVRIFACFLITHWAVSFSLMQEMKLQCDEKRYPSSHVFWHGTQISNFSLKNYVLLTSGMIYREVYEYMAKRGKGGKGENFTSQQLQAAREDYEEMARLCIFRVQSLKQGQCRSLLTQAVRHHGAQVSFCIFFGAPFDPL